MASRDLEYTIKLVLKINITTRPKIDVSTYLLAIEKSLSSSYNSSASKVFIKKLFMIMKLNWQFNIFKTLSHTHTLHFEHIRNIIHCINITYILQMQSNDELRELNACTFK